MSKTATPWKNEPGSKTIRSVKENYWLATMDSWDGQVDNEANAEFIVRACNAHDALVAVFADYPDHRENERTVDYASRVGAWALNNETAVRAALNLAEGRELSHV